MEEIVIKTRNHGLREKETELAKLLTAKCQTVGKKEEQQHSCRCSVPFILKLCLIALSTPLFDCDYSIVRIFVDNAFTQFDFQTL